MFSGGEYDEVARWLRNFVASHAKRENLRVEPEVDTEGPREGQSYGVRLRLGAALSPALELAFGVRDQLIPVLVQDHGNDPRRHVVPTAFPAAGHTGVELLHAVVLEVPVRRNVERLVDELLVVIG